MIKFIMCLIVIGVPIWVFYRSSPTTKCVDFANGKIVSVGGCNKSGWCGAMLDTGKKVDHYKPVVGEYYSQCQRWHTDWRF